MAETRGQINYSKITKAQFLTMTEVYEDITAITTKRARKLKDCDSCIATALLITYNWIHYYEHKYDSKKQEQKKPGIETQVDEVKVQVGQKDPSTLSLQALRETYPDIKARSKDSFLVKLKEAKEGKKTVMVVECKSEALKDIYSHVDDLPDDIHQIVVVNPGLDVDEKVTKLPGMYKSSELEALTEKVQNEIKDK